MRILGIDPGTSNLGWGFLEIQKGKVEHFEQGCLTAASGQSYLSRLHLLAEKITPLVQQKKPDVAVIEKIFLGKNVDSAFKLGHIRGICVVECQKQGAKIVEYSPRQVKKSLTGSGGSSKETLRMMLYAQLGCRDEGQPLDASDALAMAYCHFLQDAVDRRLRPLEGF